MKQSGEKWGCIVWPISVVGTWLLMPWATKINFWSPWLSYPLLFISLVFALYSPVNLVGFLRSVIGSSRINRNEFAREHGFTEFSTPFSTNLFRFFVFIVVPFAFIAWVFL